MTKLPQILRAVPYVFYALAVILGGLRFYNDWMTAKLSYGSNIDGLAELSGPVALYWAMTEAAYLVASGASLQVLIAIHDKMKGAAE